MSDFIATLLDQLKDSPAPRILVVGSKPKFTHEGLGRFDLGFFANASIARRHQFEVDGVYNVLAETVYTMTNEMARAAWGQIRDAGSPNTLVIQPPGWVFSRWTPISSADLAGNVRGVTLREKRGVVLDVLGWRWMLAGSWRLSPDVPFFLKQVARLVFRAQGNTTKPSTGVWCILLALHLSRQLRRPVEIVVSGIGLASDGYAYTKVNAPPRMHTHEIDPQAIRYLLDSGIKFLDLD